MMKDRNTSPEITDRVRSFMQEQRLCPPGIPLLVAASGGIDSMAAVDILRALGYPVGIAHCNFQLRGLASDEDQAFLEEYASSSGIPCFSVRFDTDAEASARKLSVQEAARQLRYDWLEQTRKEHGYHFIVTGHHRKDNVETVLYNLVKQTGIRGLHGIRPKRGKIIRPLLCLSRDDVHQYTADQGLQFREDATNTSVKYSRNFIRHRVIPELLQLNPGAIEAIDSLSRKAAEAEFLMDERLNQIRKKILLTSEHAHELKFGYVLQHPAGRTILFEILRDYGFNEQQVSAVYDGLRQQPGAEYLSASHRLLKDRRSLFILRLDAERDTIKRYDKLPGQIVFNGHRIQVREAPVEKVNMKAGSHYAYFDLDRIELPLTIRHWKKGDYFYPYGMSRDRSDKPGKKKLSKYFKDQKVPVHLKESVPVLFSGEHLIWLVGHRIDHRFRVTEDTKRVLKMKIVKGE